MATTMSPETARYLFDEGATLVLLDVPPKTEIGIDFASWNVGHKFKGLKMIPPGIHFVYYSAVSKEGDTAPRTGFFHSFQKKEVLVKRWDAYAEDFSEEDVSEAEVENVRRNLRNLDGHLGPYPYDSWKKWVSMTNHVTDVVLRRTNPLNGKISSVSQLVHDDSVETVDTSKRQKKTLEDVLLPKMMHKPGTEIRFTKLPEKTCPDGCSATEITRHNLDSSYRLELMFENYEDKDEFLGDLQIAFVCFILGQVYDAFDHWKNLVHLLCTCDDAIEKYPALYFKVIFILYHQIQEIPKDFFVDIVSSNNFLTTTLHTFFMNLQNNPRIDQELVAKGKRFQKYLTKKFKWDFQSEPDEYAPVVVELETS